MNSSKTPTRKVEGEMSLSKIIVIVLVLFHYGFAEEYYGETTTDCSDEIVITDENGTTWYDSYIKSSVKFYLLTPSNKSIELNSTNLNLLDTSQPTKILIHGLGTYNSTTWVDKMANIYHTHGNYNIIAVDWSKISVTDKIFLAVAVDSVGKMIGNFIIDVTEGRAEHLTDIHLIGSSVGAQIGGAAGKTVAKNGTTIGRITGLDPTVPEDFKVLNQSSADFVDMIHTSEVYKDRSIGTVDFFVLDGDLEHPVCLSGDSCAGSLATDLYSLSIDGDTFEGISCFNTSVYVDELCEKAYGIVMGEHVPRNVTGSYLVAKDGAPGLHEQSRILLLCIMVFCYWLK